MKLYFRMTDKMRLDWLINNIFGYVEAPDGKRYWSFETAWLDPALCGKTIRSAIDEAIMAKVNAKRKAVRGRGR